MINHYEVLGVSEDADTDVIKKAYRGLLRLTHPDSAGSDNATHLAVMINEAYHTLSDDTSRSSYDRELKAEREKGTNHTPTPTHASPAQTYTTDTPTEDTIQPEDTYDSYDSYDEQNYAPQADISYENPGTPQEYIKNIFISLYRLIAWSFMIYGKKAKISWSAAIGLGIAGLTLWGGVIGFALYNPETSMQWLGSSISFALWLSGWVFITYRSAIEAIKLGERRSNARAKAGASRKVGKAFHWTVHALQTVTSGIWVVLQTIILMAVSFYVTQALWLKIAEDNGELILLFGSALVLGWIATISVSFYYGFKIKNDG